MHITIQPIALLVCIVVIVGLMIFAYFTDKAGDDFDDVGKEELFNNLNNKN